MEFVLQPWINVYIFKENKLNYHNRCALVIFVPRRFQTVENSNQHNFTNTKPFTNYLTIQLSKNTIHKISQNNQYHNTLENKATQTPNHQTSGRSPLRTPLGGWPKERASWARDPTSLSKMKKNWQWILYLSKKCEWTIAFCETNFHTWRMPMVCAAFPLPNPLPS